MNNNTIHVTIEIPGLKKLGEAISALTESGCGIGKENKETEQEQPAAPSPVQQMPVQQAPAGGMVPLQETQPVPTAPLPGGNMQVPVTQVSTTQVPVTHTMDELAVAASQLVNMGKQNRLIEILNGFGVSSLVELPQEKYGAFAGCLKAEGVQF